jgi:hypothetical protein
MKNCNKILTIQAAVVDDLRYYCKHLFFTNFTPSTKLKDKIPKEFYSPEH